MHLFIVPEKDTEAGADCVHVILDSSSLVAVFCNKRQVYIIEG